MCSLRLPLCSLRLCGEERLSHFEGRRAMLVQLLYFALQEGDVLFFLGG